MEQFRVSSPSRQARAVALIGLMNLGRLAPRPFVQPGEKMLAESLTEVPAARGSTIHVGPDGEISIVMAPLALAVAARRRHHCEETLTSAS